MLVVTPTAVAPAWTKVLSAEVLFAPLDRTIARRARRAALAAIGEPAEGEDVRPLAEQLEELGDALSFELILAGVRDWRFVVQRRLDEYGTPAFEGIGDPKLDDHGKPVLDDAGEVVLDLVGRPAYDPLPFSAEVLAAALADGPTFDAFNAAYVLPYVTREREIAAPGKGSPRAPDGTSERTAAATATSPAPLASADGATSAPTGSTKPRRTRKKQSGTA